MELPKHGCGGINQTGTNPNKQKQDGFFYIYTHTSDAQFVCHDCVFFIYIYFFYSILNVLILVTLTAHIQSRLEMT